MICDAILIWTNVTVDVFEIVSSYLKIFSLGFAPMLVYNMGAAILQALGNARTPFYYLATTCFINNDLSES